MKNINFTGLAYATYDRIPGALKSKAKEIIPARAKKIAKNAINRLGFYGTNNPLLSVVVPVYNVSDLLEECLESISRQTYRHIEIIIIDDGSTDSSLDIARRLARQDHRIKVHTQTNAGLGAARNVGTSFARGEYLVFADSDDYVPPRAYESMIRTLQESGSDLVTGTFYRFNSRTSRVPNWCKALHAERRLGISIDEYLDGLVNVYAWNKMFRKSSWDSMDMAYTEGYRYEDQEPTTRIFLQAKSIDVIPDAVYGYRLREDESSITQTKHLIRDVQDRFHVIRLTWETISKHDNELVLRAWIAKLIKYDVMPYIREAVEADAEYKAVVSDLCRFVFQLSSQHTILNSPVKVRSVMALVLSGRWDLAGKAVLFSDETGPHLPTIVGDNLDYGSPYLKEIDLEFKKFGLSLSAEETKAVGAVRSASVAPNGNIIVEGWAFIKNLPMDSAQRSPKITVVAVNEASGIEVLMDTERIDIPGATKWSRSKWNNYEDSGFRATLPVNRLLEEYDSSKARTNADKWTFRAKVQIGDRIARTRLDRRVGGSAASYLTQGLQISDVSWQWSFNEAIGLMLTGSRDTIQLNPSIQDDKINFAIQLDEPTDIPSLRLIRGKRKPKASREQTSQGFAYDLDLEKIRRNDSQSWEVRVSGIGRGSAQLTLPGGVSRMNLGPDYAVRRDEAGRIFFEVFPQMLSITSVSTNSGSLVLRGTAVFEGSDVPATTMRLVSPKSKSKHAEPIWDGRNFSVELPLVGHAGEPLPFDGYSLRARDLEGRERAVLIADSVAAGLPIEKLVKSHRARVSMTKFGNTWIKLDAPLADEEDGSYNQKQLQISYAESQEQIEKGTVLFHAYLGGQATDSSLTLSKYLLQHKKHLKVVWATISESVEIPEGSERVILNSKRWYSLLAKAEYLVHNIYFDPWFSLKTGQSFVQTWHGTPLKTINRSYWEGIGRSTAWIERMEAQARTWTHLISPSPYCSEILTSESGFIGELLEVGYPRNDELTSSELSDEKRSQIRLALGISPEEKVVLYAPTWRESLSSKSWQAEMVQFLDAEKLSDDLGQDYRILVRGHGHNARSASSKKSDGNVLDVTHYPNINDLYLAADTIVTDYSSVMFDAVVANKVLLFFVPDLEEYNSSSRGVYLNIADIAPGPLFKSQAELTESLLNLDTSRVLQSKAYEDFKQKFSPYDDGQASKRVVESIWS